MALRRELAAAAEAYFHRQALIYLLVAVLFAAGSLFGALAATALTPGQAAGVAGEVRAFIGAVKSGDFGSRAEVARTALVRDVIRTVGLCWLLGLSVVGLPLVLVIVFSRGFLLGFTVAVLVKELAIGGLAVALVAILPQSLLNVPATVVAAVGAVSFAVALMRDRSLGRAGFWRGVGAYTALASGAAVVMAGGALVEGYVAPVLLQWTVRYLI
ncbi:MAG TPA: stage II sporulation protein M [Firmicutes bacterium]|nr:stage II sporulation protein M [Bacillota bacterium]